MLKTYKAAIRWFDPPHDKKIELAKLLWGEAATDFDDDMEFEPKLLSDEEVNYARLMADAVFKASSELERLSSR